MMCFKKWSVLGSVLSAWWLTTTAALCQYTFTKVVDTTATFPGNATKFTSFQEPVVHAGVVAFAGSSATNSGIFRWTNGVLQKAVDYSTTLPGSAEAYSFAGGFTVYVENGVVSFRGIGSAVNGIYQYDGATLTRLADTTTPNPAPGGSTPFTFLYAPNMKDGLVGFIAETTNFARGIFLSSNGVMSAKLVPSMAYPGGAGRFALSSQIGLDDGNIAFVGIDDGNNTRHGIFTLSGGDVDEGGGKQCDDCSQCWRCVHRYAKYAPRRERHEGGVLRRLCYRKWYLRGESGRQRIDDDGLDGHGHPGRHGKFHGLYGVRI